MTGRLFTDESEPVATNPVVRGIDLALERLVRRDCFTERTLRVLDEVRAEVLAAPPRDQRFDEALDQIAYEAIRSIEKHGEQGHLPMGTGPCTLPLDVDYAVGGLWPEMTADRLAVIATADTKFHSANEGGDGTVTWWQILREEVFEAAAEDDPATLREELVQVAAVALKMIDALDHTNVETPA